MHVAPLLVACFVGASHDYVECEGEIEKASVATATASDFRRVGVCLEGSKRAEALP